MDVVSSQTIPVMTETTINFEVYAYSRQQDALDQQGRAVSFNVPETQARGIQAKINSFAGDAQSGYRDFGFEEFLWGETVQAALPNVHSGLSSWDNIIAGAEGAALVEAGKLALLSLIRSTIPNFSATIVDGLGIPIYARMQRMESILRWDQPDNNRVLAYVQFGSDAEFTRKLLTQPFVFLPPSGITRYVPRQQDETTESWQARRAEFCAINNIGDLKTLLDLPDFSALARQIYTLVFTELKAKAFRYANINVATITAGFDSSYPLIQAAADLGRV